MSLAIEAPVAIPHGALRAPGRDAAAHQTVCAGHPNGPCLESVEPPSTAFRKSVVDQRRGQPWRCGPCAGMVARGRQTPEARSEGVRKAWITRRKAVA